MADHKPRDQWKIPPRDNENSPDSGGWTPPPLRPPLRDVAGRRDRKSFLMVPLILLGAITVYLIIFLFRDQRVAPSLVAPVSATPVPTASIASVGRIIVNTVPTNASVYLDGVSEGRTPIILQNISEGVHRIRLEAIGYDDTALVAEVKPGAATDLGTVRLPEKPQPTPVAETTPSYQTTPAALVTPPLLAPPGDNNVIPTSFSDFFGRVWGHQRTNDPSDWASDFASQVAYCYKDNGFASRSWVQQDRAKLIERYPARDYQMVGNPSFNRSSDLEIKAEYRYRYNYYGKKHASGQAYVMFTATLEKGEWRISKFNEVINRD